MQSPLARVDSAHRRQTLATAVRDVVRERVKRPVRRAVGKPAQRGLRRTVRHAPREAARRVLRRPMQGTEHSATAPPSCRTQTPGRIKVSVDRGSRSVCARREGRARGRWLTRSTGLLLIVWGISLPFVAEARVASSFGVQLARHPLTKQANARPGLDSTVRTKAHASQRRGQVPPACNSMHAHRDDGSINSYCR